MTVEILLSILRQRRPCPRWRTMRVILVLVAFLSGCVGTVMADDGAPSDCERIWQACEEPVTACPGRCVRAFDAGAEDLFCLPEDGCPQ